MQHVTWMSSYHHISNGKMFFSRNLCSRTNSEKHLPCLFCIVDLFSGEVWLASQHWIPAKTIICKESDFGRFFFLEAPRVSLILYRERDRVVGQEVPSQLCYGETCWCSAHGCTCCWIAETSCLGRAEVPSLCSSQHPLGPLQLMVEKSSGSDSATSSVKAMIDPASIPQIALICVICDCVVTFIWLFLFFFCQMLTFGSRWKKHGMMWVWRVRQEKGKLPSKTKEKH